jgi:Ca2+-binding EF-hand superfamily protein
MFNMVKFAKGSVEDKLRFMFHTHDLDGDGFLTVEELYRIYRSLFRSEGLATDEVELEAKVNRLVKEILEKGDRNHDAAINEEGRIHSLCTMFQSDEL